MSRGISLSLLVILSLRTVAHAEQPATLKAKAPEVEERPQQEWINSKPLKLSELRGQVVVLHFWTFGCINCRHNYPSLKTWQEKFSKKGVTIIGVHTPETTRESEIENVRASAEENGLKYPIVFDKDASTWKTWNNRYWPSTYLIDKTGFVRYRWDGEFNWKNSMGEAIMRKKIEQLLAEPGPEGESKLRSQGF
jgi:peroxiredoxin